MRLTAANRTLASASWRAMSGRRSVSALSCDVVTACARLSASALSQAGRENIENNFIGASLAGLQCRGADAFVPQA